MTKLNKIPSLEPLTDREYEILALLAEGLSNREIAQRLYISVATVKWHNHRIFTKLGVRSRTEAVLLVKTKQVHVGEPILTTNGVADNLPQLPTQFIGREQELIELSNMLNESELHIITMLGSGGIGKSWLAIELARRDAEAFVHGVCFVSLTPLKSLDEVITTTARALRFPLQSDQRTSDQQILDYLSDKNMLILFDNFEHLMDATAFANSITEAAPGVKLLTTSREKLNIRRENLFLVGSLTFPYHGVPPDSGEYSALKLLEKTAQRYQRDFRLNDDNIQDAVRICQLVDGIPLGIVLAASWVSVLSLREVLDQLTTNFDLLETSIQDIPKRQKSMRAVFEHSWKQLSNSERKHFSWYSVFRGGFTRDAAHHLSGATVKVLQALVHKSLLQRDPVTGRYDMHQLVRQYALEQLRLEGDIDTALNAHMQFYAEFMESRDAELKGVRQLQALNEIEAEFENIRNACMRAIEEKANATLNQMIESLYLFCSMRSRLREGINLLEKAKYGVNETHPIWGRIVSRWLWLRVRDRSLPNNIDEKNVFKKLGDQSLSIAIEHENQPEVAFTLWVLGYITENMREYELSNTYFDDSLKLFQELNDSYYTSHVLQRYGLLNTLFGQYESARDFIQKSLNLSRDIGDQFGVALSLQIAGAIHLISGSNKECISDYYEVIEIWEKLENLSGLAYAKALITVPMLLTGKADDVTIQLMITSALTIATDIRDDRSMGWALAHYALWHIFQGMYSEAKQLCQDAQNYLLSPWVTCHNNWIWSLACLGLREHQTANDRYVEALRFAYKSKARGYMFWSMFSATLIYYEQGHYIQATKLLGFMETYPINVSGLFKNLEFIPEMRTVLEQELGNGKYNQLREQGKSMEYEEIAEELITIQK